MLKKLAVAAVAAMVGVGVASAADYTVKPQVTSLKTTPKTVLLVGNSFMYYNCGVNGTLSGIVKAKGGKLASTMATIGGAGLDWHDVKLSAPQWVAQLFDLERRQQQTGVPPVQRRQGL